MVLPRFPSPSPTYHPPAIAPALKEIVITNIEELTNAALVLTPAKLAEAVACLVHGPFLCFDVETIGEHRGDPWRNDVLWIALSNGECTYVIPMGHPNGEFVESIPALKANDDLTARLARGLQPRKSDYSSDSALATVIWADPPQQLTRTEVFAALKPLLNDPTLLKVGHNLSFDLGSVAKYIGGIPAGPYADTMIGAFLIDSDKGYGFGLKDVAKKYANIDMEKGVGANIALHSFIEVAKYAYLDAYATTRAWLTISQRIVSDQLEKVFSLEMQVVPVVTQMRLTGTPIDTDGLETLAAQLESDLESSKAKVFRVAGREFNLNATRDKQFMLYGPKAEGGRALQPKLLTASGKDKKKANEKLTYNDYSTSADAVEIYRGEDALVDAILEYSDISKLLSTYVIPYMGGERIHTVNGRQKVSKQTALLDRGRLHTDFNQIGAATGRFSSRNPNLQNVPNASTEYGKLIRNLFIAPPGHKLVVADYSQIEPRIIASFSKDPVMLSTYRDGGDIYTAIGDTMGVDRKAGKVLVLSIAYGVGPDKIASQVGCTVDEARDLLTDFEDKFKNVMKLKALTIRTAKKQAPVPFVATITGRRRYLPELNSNVWWMQQKAERQCFNTLVQGSAADVMKIALIRAQEAIPPEARITLTVHDELVTTAPDAIANDVVEAIRGAMEGINFLQVPLVADINVADSWGDAK